MNRTLPWVVPTAVAAAVAPFVRGDGGDAHLFVRAGSTLLSSHWSLAFADRTVQAGPLQLALFGSVGRSPAALAAVLAAAVTLLVVAAAHAAGIEKLRLLGLAGATALVSGLAVNAYEAGHPADTILPLLWILAAADARRGRTVRAGMIVGLTVGIETWGCLGVAVLALAPSLRRALAGSGAAALVATALFLPFVVAGHFEMTAYRWSVEPDSPLTAALAAGSSFGWPLRVVQAVAAVAAGCTIAHAARRSRHALWITPLAVVAVRLLLHPAEHFYYFASVEAPAVVGFAVVTASGLRLRGPRRESIV